MSKTLIQKNYIDLDKKTGEMILHVFNYTHLYYITLVNKKQFNDYNTKENTDYYAYVCDDHIKIKTNIKHLDSSDNEPYSHFGKFKNMKEIVSYAKELYEKSQKEIIKKKQIDLSKIVDETYILKGLSLYHNDGDGDHSIVNFNKTRSKINIGCSTYKSANLKEDLQNVINAYDIMTKETKFGKNWKFKLGDNWVGGDGEYAFIISKENSKVDVSIVIDEQYDDDSTDVTIELLKEFINLIDNKLKNSKYFERLIPGNLYEFNKVDEFIYNKYVHMKDEAGVIEYIWPYDGTEEAFEICGIYSIKSMVKKDKKK